MDEYHAILEKSRLLYFQKKQVWCPYFKENIIFGSEGFNHLLNKRNLHPRTVEEQQLKLRFLKPAISVLASTATLQEYRKGFEKYGKPGKDGLRKTKLVQYWAFHNIIGKDKSTLIRVVVRKVGDGPYHFWSTMPVGRLGKQKLYQTGIEDI